MPYSNVRAHLRRTKIGVTGVSRHVRKAPDIGKHYVRFRQEEPSKFEPGTFRTIDVGRPGHTKIVVGHLKRTGELRTQTVLVTRTDYDKKKKYYQTRYEK